MARITRGPTLARLSLFVASGLGCSDEASTRDEKCGEPHASATELEHTILIAPGDPAAYLVSLRLFKAAVCCRQLQKALFQPLFSNPGERKEPSYICSARHLSYAVLQATYRALKIMKN